MALPTPPPAFKYILVALAVIGIISLIGYNYWGWFGGERTSEKIATTERGSQAKKYLENFRFSRTNLSKEQKINELNLALSPYGASIHVGDKAAIPGPATRQQKMTCLCRGIGFCTAIGFNFDSCTELCNWFREHW